MSKKKAAASDIYYRIAIEEFFFVLEQSIYVICPKGALSGKRTINPDREESRLKSTLHSFYLENKAILYPDTDVVLNGFVGFNSKNGDINVKNDVSLLQLFQSKDMIEELSELAEDSIKNHKDKNEFIHRLRSNISELRCMLSCINDLPLVSKLWREVLLEESKRLLDCLEKEDIPQGNYRVKVLVLKSLIEAAGINPSKQGDKQLFIAKILGTTQMNVKDIFSDLRNEENYEIIKDQSEEAIQICEYLKNKNDENSNTAIKRMIENISLAGTAEYKNIK